MTDLIIILRLEALRIIGLILLAIGVWVYSKTRKWDLQGKSEMDGVLIMMSYLLSFLVIVAGVISILWVIK